MQDRWFGNEHPNTGKDEQIPLDKAREYLQRAEKDYLSFHVYYLLKWVRMGCTQAGITVETLGTTEERLKEIERIGYKSWAEFYLKYLRGWKIPVEVNVNNLVEYIKIGLRHGNWTLDNIAVKEEELKTYVVMGEKRDEALLLYGEMQQKKRINPSFKNPDNVKKIRALLELAKYTLEMAGINSQDLKDLE